MATQNAADSRAIADANALRAPAYALGTEIGNEFVILLSDGWQTLGVDGVRAACWSLAQMVSEVPGSWDLYHHALQIAAGRAPSLVR